MLINFYKTTRHSWSCWDLSFSIVSKWFFLFRLPNKNLKVEIPKASVPLQKFLSDFNPRRYISNEVEEFTTTPRSTKRIFLPLAANFHRRSKRAIINSFLFPFHYLHPPSLSLTIFVTSFIVVVERKVYPRKHTDFENKSTPLPLFFEKWKRNKRTRMDAVVFSIHFSFLFEFLFLMVCWKLLVLGKRRKIKKKKKKWMKRKGEKWKRRWKAEISSN